jgi:hypothetical protein
MNTDWKLNQHYHLKRWKNKIRSMLERKGNEKIKRVKILKPKTKNNHLNNSEILKVSR